jgi:hypothetical protein
VGYLFEDIKEQQKKINPYWINELEKVFPLMESEFGSNVRVLQNTV